MQSNTTKTVSFSKKRVPLWLSNLLVFKKQYKETIFVIGESIACPTIFEAKESAKQNAYYMSPGEGQLIVEDEYLRRLSNGKYEIAILFKYIAPPQRKNIPVRTVQPTKTETKKVITPSSSYSSETLDILKPKRHIYLNPTGRGTSSIGH